MGQVLFHQAVSRTTLTPTEQTFALYTVKKGWFKKSLKYTKIEIKMTKMVIKVTKRVINFNQKRHKFLSIFY